MPTQNAGTLDILERLCAFDTTSHKSNLDCIEYCREFLLSLGFSVSILPNKKGDKENLHAVLGDVNKRGIVFAGHTDVVPVEGQTWNSNPFQLKIEQDKLIGRGVVDMKGFLAVILSQVSMLEPSTLKMPVHILMTYDEESGCFGARDFQDHIMNYLVPGSFCLVGEPTDVVPVVAHKGIKGFRCNILASEGHAAQVAKKSNAIHFASELIAYLLQQQDFYASSAQTKNVYPLGLIL